MRRALWAAAMTMKRFLIAAALTLPVAAGAQRWVTEPQRVGVVARGEGLLRQAMLAGHDAVRQDFGAPALTWDARLAEDAKAYARELARTDRFQHSTGRHGQGANLWTGTRGAYAYGEMVGAWADEQRDFRPGVVPNVSRTGRFADVGHYVQMVWPATTRLGCATASNRGRDYLVCRYAPPGNVVGQPIGIRSRR
jgi:hypothetical protein